ncbi:MAG: 3-phosphoshikimate 1-carboxyvinyltransferase, partial [Candidatus Methylomirabilis sp.]|nr:3-phosphoshikimate 1-carboxyvinyltransferase [Deltaproteobacteria bacterium]
YMGNSGTTTRLLAGVLAAQPFHAVLAGDPYLNRRPMRRVADPLRAMGARIDGREGGQYPPLSIRGGGLKGIAYELPVLSAQVKSAIILAGLTAEGDTAVLEREATRDHTERMLRAMGARIDVKDAPTGRTVLVRRTEALRPLDIDVPGDISSAAFFLVAGLLVPRSDIRIDGVGVNETRTGVLDALRAMGARIEELDGRQVSGEPVGDLIVQTSALRATKIGGAIVPRLIDEVPILAVAATQAEGVTQIRDAEELRVKESDRIAAVADELGKMGARIVEKPDGMDIEGPVRLRGARVSSRGDHRIAMSLAVAALVAEGETEIEDVENVATSFPGFFDRLRSLRAE